MANRSRHENEAEIQRLIENWARWPGFHAGTSSRSSIAWLMDFVARRQDSFGPSVPVMGGEAADTHAALMRMERPLRDALIANYTATGGLAQRVAAYNWKKRTGRIGERQFRYYVARARDVFWQYWSEERASAQRSSERNRAQANIVGSPDLVTPSPRQVPTHGPVTWVKVK